MRRLMRLSQSVMARRPKLRFCFRSSSPPKLCKLMAVSRENCKLLRRKAVALGTFAIANDEV
jgi:hypothetical protein